MSSKTMFKLCCIVLIVTLLFESSLGQTCVIDGVDEADWASSKNVNFEDAARDEVFSASTTNVAGISSYSQTGNLNFKSDYITPSYQGGVFTLTLTDAFADYEKQETLREFNLVVVFSCASQSRTLTIICRITDRNTYPPEFLPSNSYQYEIFTPMPPGVPISKLYGPISVVDYDLTTSSIDFTIEPNDYLEIVYDSVDSSKKIHTAILMTKSAILTIEGQREIKIFATDKDDTNDPPFTSEATITLTSNPVAQLPSAPQFSKPYFTGTIKDGLLTIDDQIEITSGYDDEIKFSLSDDKYFQVANTEKVVTITLKAPIPDEILENTDHFLFSVHAALQNTAGGSATVYVSIPKDDSVLKFEQSTYTGTYSDNELKIEDIILDGYNTKVDVKLTGDYEEFFDIEIVGTNSVRIKKVKDLTAEIIDSTSRLLLLLEATTTGKFSSTTVVIDLPKVPDTILKFEELYYTGTYSYDDAHLTPLQVTLTEGYSESVHFELSGDGREYFTISPEDNKVTVTGGNLPESLLEAGSLLLLTLSAAGPGSISTATTLAITLVAPIDYPIQFVEVVQRGSYSFKDKELILLPIFLADGFPTDVTYELTGENNRYFALKPSDNNVEIVKQADIPEELAETLYITLVLQALSEHSSSIGQTVVTIALLDGPSEQTKILKFEQANYKGNYLEDNKLELPAIKLTEMFDLVKYVLTGDYSDNFEITSQDSTMIIEVMTELSDEILNSYTHIVLVVEAQVTGAVSGQTSIVIDLPNKDGVKVLKFEQANYKGNYLDNDQLELPVIKLTEVFDVVKYVLTGDFSDNFEITSQDSTVIFAVKAPLSVEILNTYTHIVLVVEAQVTGAVSGQTSIVIDLPIKEEGVQRKILKFKQANYKGNYLDNDILDLPVIELTEVFDVVKYVLTGDFSDNFEITSQSSTVTFEVKNPLSDETLDTFTHIVLVVEAQVTDAASGQTSIVIDLPIRDGVQRKVLKFEQANYKGNYLDNDKLELPAIKLTEMFDVVKYVLTGDFSENFEITSQDSTVIFAVKAPLSVETLNTYTHIVLVVEAQVTDALSGQTSIVIDLPIKDGTGVILQFEDPYYEVQYKDNHEIDVPAIKLTKEYDSVDFTLSGEFKDHFSVTSTGESTAVLAVIIHLPAEVLEEKSFLVLVLEASLTEAVGAKATINIALPIKDITIAVSFDETFYSGLYAYSTNTLTIPVITLVEGYNDNTDFSLSGENSELFETDSDGNTVTLKIKGNLPESLLDVTSVLLFSIQAVRPGAPLATAVIAISLRAKAGIPGNALTIIDILEQKSYQNMNIGDIEDNCKYVKKSTWPESTPDWFEVDSTGKFLNIKEISREDPSVAFLYLSQAQLELSIDCSTSIRRNATKENDDAGDAERYWISTKSINYSPDKRMVTVIIRDINNNPPVFDTANPLIIGFPIQDIAYVIRPQALYTVHATDKDIGINAEIKYTTDNDYFSVHPETGVIYPKHDLYTENALTETINFKVSATDGEDESGSTHTVDLNIMVKPLKQSDISIITIEDAVIEDIPEIISTLSDKLNSKVHMLTSAVLPSTNHLRSQNNNHMDKFLRSKRDFSGEDTSLAMFIYALDNQNEIISGSELVSKIEGIVDVGNLDWTVTSIPLSESSLMGGLGKTSSNTGLIAATAVLGSLLFITLVGIVVFYFLVVRKKYRTFSNSHSSGSDVSSIQSEEDKKSNLDYVDEVGTSQLDNLTMGDVIIPGFARELDNENQGQIKGTNSSDVDEDEYGEPSSKGRRKSMVTFNEKVLQIDIDPSYEDERL